MARIQRRYQNARNINPKNLTYGFGGKPGEEHYYHQMKHKIMYPVLLVARSMGDTVPQRQTAGLPPVN
jgi:hypothetical protein